MSASSIRKSLYEPSVAPPREGSSSRTTDDTQVRHSQGKAYDYVYRRRQRIAKVLGAAAAHRGSGKHGYTPTQQLILYETVRTRSEPDHLYAQGKNEQLSPGKK